MNVKMIALKDVSVQAQILVSGSIEMPRDRQGQRMGKMPRQQSVERTFNLRRGESKVVNVVFLISVSTGNQFPEPRQIQLPSAVGEKTQDGDLLALEGVE